MERFLCDASVSPSWIGAFCGLIRAYCWSKHGEQLMNSSPTETVLYADILRRQMTMAEQSSSSKAASQVLPLARPNAKSRVTCDKLIFGIVLTCSGSRSFNFLVHGCPASSYQYFSGSAGWPIDRLYYMLLTTMSSLFFSKQLEIAVLGLQV